MEPTLARQIAALQKCTVKQLRQKFVELFGEATNGNNKTWLIRRIAWRLQARAEGGLSERARRLANELADDANLRMNPPAGLPVPSQTEETPPQVLPFQADQRLPPPGTLLSRKYKGEVLQVKILAEGFEFRGEVFGSLSAVAKAITGSHCNGFAFFRLGTKETNR